MTPQPALLVWRFRRLPGPTPAHLWAPDATNPLCGLTRRASGEWVEDDGSYGRCGLCERKRARYYPSVPVSPP